MDTCSECERPADARGWCKMHWRRWRKHGDPSVILPHAGGNREGNLRKRTLNQEYFDDIATPEQAYWLGFFTADGSVMRGKRSYLLRLALKESDQDHVRAFRDALGGDHELKLRDTERYAATRSNTVSVTISSKHMLESLEKLGVTSRKSLTAKPWNGPNELMPHYWRGLFDGDGTIYRSTAGWFVGICGSSACVEAFAEWARSVSGSKAKCSNHKESPGCWVWKTGGGPIPQLLVKALYRDASVALPRKKARAESLMAISFLRRGEVMPCVDAVASWSDPVCFS